jgi:hypothetical protein
MIIILVEKYDSSKEIDQTKIFFLNNYKQIKELKVSVTFLNLRDKWRRAFDLGTDPYSTFVLFVHPFDCAQGMLCGYLELTIFDCRLTIYKRLWWGKPPTYEFISLRFLRLKRNAGFLWFEVAFEPLG